MSEENGYPFDRQIAPIPVFVGSLFPRFLGCHSPNRLHYEQPVWYSRQLE